jgi:hypothetical protein
MEKLVFPYVLFILLLFPFSLERFEKKEKNDFNHIFFAYICCVSHADASIREVRVVWEMYYIRKTFT